MSIRVLIVEDSPVVRELLEHLVGSDPRFRVVGSVPTAEDALAVLPRLKPDVVSMDINLPGMNGLDAITEIMHNRPTPTVVVSASARPDEVKLTMDALGAGALAVVEKPPGPGDPRHARLARRLLSQLAIMSRVKVIRQRRITVRRRPPAARSAAPVRPPASGYAALGIVASTGGPGALEVLLGSLRPGFPVPILLVQHIGESFLDGFVQWLGGLCPLPTRKARAGETPRPGTVHVAPDRRHLAVINGRLRLLDTDLVCFQRPSGTVLLESMATEYGRSGIGVVLTGMGEDGATGLAAMRESGGYTIAEDASTAVVYGMPRAAVELGGACEELPLDAIGPRLNDLVPSPVKGEA
ncbi:MAG: chemotaxis-specific protein-glutamate methyltransferase CheB [Planctomycetota bacterium]|nr:chemotaxis-specific protein-glutamate methyltransferase CheB [Planctomycetota bacterium]